jgi:type II restriction/modification system DNA methylase subunit YeeA
MLTRLGISSQNINNKVNLNWIMKILTTKKGDRHADTSELEKECDHLVYQLYGLTEEEIKIVEGER